VRTQNNHYQYTSGDEKKTGYFNIYQARNGLIYLQMGDKVTLLTFDQIGDLRLNLYDLDEFDYDAFVRAYKALF